MFERFTDRARTVAVSAQTEAQALGSDRIGTEHPLLGVLRQRESTGALVLASFGVTRTAVMTAIEAAGGRCADVIDARALSTIGIDLDEVRRHAEEAFGPGALERTRTGHRRGHIPFSPLAKRTLERSLRESRDLRHRCIGDEHIMLALLREGEGEGHGLAARILAGHKVTYEAARSAVLARLLTAG